MRLKILSVTSIGLILLGMEVAKGAEVAPTATNIPTSNPQSSTPANSLAMLLQVVKQLEHCVQTTNLSSIHNEDMILSAASSELLTQADLVTTNHTDEFKSALTVFCQKVSTLHLAADLSRQAQAEAVLREVVESFQTVKGYFSQEIIAAAQPSVDAFTCPIHRDVVGKKSDFCPKCGTKLDQFCRILPAGYGFPLAGQPGIRASVHTLTPLTVGQPVSAILRLEKPNGLPVLPADLIETHTTRIHLLLVDTSLTDYHHEHPQPTRAPGDYTFSFVPRKPGSYRVWADLRPYPLGLQEYAQAYIVAATPPEPLTDRAVKLKTAVDGFDFELIPGSEAIHVGRPTAMKLRITTPDGKGVTQLEPVMETFAHLVGFNEDHKTVLHLHPKGESVMDPKARGGPELEFIIYALRPGFVRLFAQVQIEGRPRFAPFGLQVRP